MTITTVSIPCDVGLPDNTEFIAARIDFTLSGPDYDTVSNDAIPAATVSVTLDADGEGTADLWPVDRGTRNTSYAVVLWVSFTANGRVVSDGFTLGTIRPPSAGGDLADLLAQSSGGMIVGSTVYATIADAVAAAQDAAAAGADPIAAIAARDAAVVAQGLAEDAAVATAADRVQTGLDVTAAETARDAAFGNADVYADIAAGLAAVAVGGQFQVAGSDETIRYRVDTGPVEVEILRLPTTVAARNSAQAGLRNLLSDADLDFSDANLWQNVNGNVPTRVLVDGQPGLSKTSAGATNAVALQYLPVSLFEGSELISIAVEILSAGSTASTGSANRITLRQGLADVTDSVAASTLDLPTTAITTPTWFRIEGMPLDAAAKRMDITVRRNNANFVIGRVIVTAGPTANERLPNLSRDIAEVAGRTFVSQAMTAIDRVYMSNCTNFSTVIGPLFEQTGGGLTVGGSNVNAYFVATDFYFVADTVCEAEVTLEKVGATAVRAALAVGGSAINATGRLSYSYETTGAVQQFNDTWTGATSLLAADASRDWGAGEVVKVKLRRRADGTGTVTVTAPDGSTHSAEVTGVPVGRVWMVWRCGTASDATVELQAFRGALDAALGIDAGISAEIAALDTRVTAVEAALPGLGVLSARGGRVLPTPDSLTGRTPPGWTCTGGDVFDFGTLSGLVVASDDGRLVEGDSSDYGRALHFLTPSFGRVVKTLTLPSPTLSSTQGVAIDRGLYVGTLWAAHGAGDNRIRNYDAPSGALDGSASAATENAGRAIGWSSDLSLSSNVNGLAFDSDHGAALWASPIVGAYAVQIDIAGKTVFDTVTLASSSPDQLQYLSASATPDGQARLIYTTGSNGADGTVRVYNLVTDEDEVWAVLPSVQAIEQFFYDPVTNIGWALSDGGYHNSADPAENRVWFFDMPPLPV